MMIKQSFKTMAEPGGEADKMENGKACSRGRYSRCAQPRLIVIKPAAFAYVPKIGDLKII